MFDGWASKAESQPSLVSKHRALHPDWRGKWPGADRRNRAKARLDMSVAERAGEVDETDPIRARVVRDACSARSKIQAGRARKQQRYIREAIRKTEADLSS